MEREGRLLCNPFNSLSKLVTNSDRLGQIGSAALLLLAARGLGQSVAASRPLCWMDLSASSLASPRQPTSVTALSRLPST